jgi:hypothetical protein
MTVLARIDTVPPIAFVDKHQPARIVRLNPAQNTYDLTSRDPEERILTTYSSFSSLYPGEHRIISEGCGIRPGVSGLDGTPFHNYGIGIIVYADWWAIEHWYDDKAIVYIPHWKQSTSMPCNGWINNLYFECITVPWSAMGGSRHATYQIRNNTIYAWVISEDTGEVQSMQAPLTHSLHDLTTACPNRDMYIVGVANTGTTGPVFLSKTYNLPI